MFGCTYEEQYKKLEAEAALTFAKMVIANTNRGGIYNSSLVGNGKITGSPL